MNQKLKKSDLETLEGQIGYTFRNVCLFQEAMTHRSALYEGQMRPQISNERLEFLGDSVLGVVIANHLMALYPDDDEGGLTQKKSGIVCETNLAEAGRHLRLGDFLIVGKQEECNGVAHRDRALADAVEALIGAVFLEGGIDAATTVIINLPIFDPKRTDYKSELQEIVQARKLGTPAYVVEKEFGPAHAREYAIAVKVNGRTIGKGTAVGKKLASQAAAKAALSNLGTWS